MYAKNSMKRLTRKEIKLELESLLHIVGISSDSATIKGDLITLRVIMKYMQFDREACERELKTARNNKQ